ncbi:MAG: TrkA C-terminal domain-containing protein [Phycisphaerales bacterium]|nr:MAG: TrkA C-terminal domain-containing protein [Phycisphaerales bacterium]
MIALVSLLVIITLSVIIVRIGSVALVMTGLSKDLAVFQAQSAFSGVGFTTRESESVVRHPTRRRIIRLLMLMGNAGFTSAIAGLVLTFYSGSPETLAFRLGLVVLGLVVLWIISTSKLMDRFLTRVIRAALRKWTGLEVRDYARLLELDKGYAVAEIEIGPEDWLCNHRLSELNLTQEGILVLGVRRARGNYVGAPYGQTEIMLSDVLMCYGPEKILRELPHRLTGSKGDEEHAAAVEVQEQIRAKQGAL